MVIFMFKIYIHVNINDLELNLYPKIEHSLLFFKGKECGI